MLIPGRVVPGRVPVLERPPPCTVSGTRGLVNAPLSDAPCSVLHTHGGPRAILGPFACLADVHQSTIACDRHLACEVRAGALMSLGARPCCIVRGPASCSVAKGEHDRRDGTGRRRPRRGRGMFGRTCVSCGGVGAALPAARQCAILDLHPSGVVWCLFRKKKKKNPRTPTSVLISVIRYANRTEVLRRTDRYRIDHKLPSENPIT
jgi:hypothetical protein